MDYIVDVTDMKIADISEWVSSLIKSEIVFNHDQKRIFLLGSDVLYV